VSGLRQPEPKGDRRWARMQLIRAWGPVVGLVTTLGIAGLLALGGFGASSPVESDFWVRIGEGPEPGTEVREGGGADALDPVVKPAARSADPFAVAKLDADMAELTDRLANTPVSPREAEAEPRPLPEEFRGRSSGGREGVLKGNGGGADTEAAVLRALRWLSACQEPDGSWNGTSGRSYARLVNKDARDSEALTSLALLAFLGHGELPGMGGEFETTVTRSLDSVIGAQGTDGGIPARGDSWSGGKNNDAAEYPIAVSGSRGYAHPIGTYALCEAYGMIGESRIKRAAERALDFMIAGQRDSGGWNYGCRPGESSSPRIDVSITSWCVQALRAAQIGGLRPEKVERAAGKAAEALTRTFWDADAGVFRYDNLPNRNPESFPGLTSAGVLSLQLLGQADTPEARRGMQWLDRHATCDWQNPWPGSPIYYWYYTTQVQFRRGGLAWREWNRQMQRSLLSNQKILKNAGHSPDGKSLDLGYWTLPRHGSDCFDGLALTYSTAMCALQLEVYYRHLPTSRVSAQAPGP
jgi:hypothetical protein